VPIRDDKAAPLAGERGGGSVELTEGDLRDIESAASKIEVQGLVFRGRAANDQR